jgi:UDP-glucose 4-epimerase
MDGTFNLYEAAAAAKVAKVVLASSMAVYGASMQSPPDAWGVVTKDSPVLPDDEYGLSKWLGEELARYHARRQDLATVALRLGMFAPETFERYGFRLLFGGVDDRDVAQAVVLALEHEPAGGFEVVDVMAEVPFHPGDTAELQADPAAVLERYWPGCITLLHDRGLELEELLWGRLIWPIDKAKRVLGYRPGHNFGEFLTALRAGDTGYYPFANLPWWGRLRCRSQSQLRMSRSRFQGTVHPRPTVQATPAPGDDR